jgi:hypothetical protein
MKILRFLILVVLLNVIRYVAGEPLEMWTVLPHVFGEMERHPDYFRTEFTQFDWITSYLYNFMVWLVVVWLFHLARPAIRGRDMIVSLEVFGLMWLFFASVSAVYMNHYSHPRDFYLYNVADALLMFALVGAANGLLYRRVMGRHAASPGFGRAGDARG